MTQPGIFTRVAYRTGQIMLLAAKVDMLPPDDPGVAKTRAALLAELRRHALVLTTTGGIMDRKTRVAKRRGDAG